MLSPSVFPKGNLELYTLTRFAGYPDLFGQGDREGTVSIEMLHNDFCKLKCQREFRIKISKIQAILHNFPTLKGV